MRIGAIGIGNELTECTEWSEIVQKPIRHHNADLRTRPNGFEMKVERSMGVLHGTDSTLRGFARNGNKHL